MPNVTTVAVAQLAKVVMVCGDLLESNSFNYVSQVGFILSEILVFTSTSLTPQSAIAEQSLYGKYMIRSIVPRRDSAVPRRPLGFTNGSKCLYWRGLHQATSALSIFMADCCSPSAEDGELLAA